MLTVYIEGDGLAYVTTTQPSPDPTPRDPVALKMAVQDGSEATAWLGRPCQYVIGAERRHCEERYWTSHRFAESVVAATDQAIDALMLRAGAHYVALVGYSGGGAVAALVAARRHDVVRLITVAGNLDPPAWTSWHAITPLSGSLNPADGWRELQDIPQVHWVGGQDRVVGRQVADAYASHFPGGHLPQIREVADADHHCCWVERWPQLLRASWQ
jgi:pimeloyl-ACP methyl ester carboxylesterase